MVEIGLSSAERNIKQDIMKIIEENPSQSLTVPRSFSVYSLNLIHDEIEIEEAIDYTEMDGSDDNGIDGLYIDETDKCIYFYQFKTKKQNMQPDIDKFNRECVNDITNAKNFLIDLKNGKERRCNKELKKYTETIREKIVDEGYSLIGRIVINGRLTESANSSFKSAVEDFKENNIELQKFNSFELAKLKISGRWGGVEPPSNIHLCFQKNKFYYDKSEGVVAGQVGVNEIREVIGKQDNDYKLFGYNYRYYLGTSYNIGNVNREINETLSDKSIRSKFHLLNNGIRIVCKDIKPRNADLNCFDILEPQIVNGGQTSMVISKTKKMPKNVTVDLKIIKANEKLARSIARGTNYQTTVERWDFKANDPYQRHLLDEFSKMKPAYWYDIKRGEFDRRIRPKPSLKNKYKIKGNKYRRIDPDDLSRAVLSFLGNPAAARTSKKEFSRENGLYKEIFNVELTPSEYLLFYLIYKNIDEKIKVFKREYLKAEDKDFQEELNKFRGRGYRRYAKYFIVASIGYLFKIHYGEKKIGSENSTYLIKNKKKLKKIIDELYDIIIDVMDSEARHRENYCREDEKDPEWSNYFKNNQNYRKYTLRELEDKITKEEISRIFKVATK